MREHMAPPWEVFHTGQIPGNFEVQPLADRIRFREAERGEAEEVRHLISAAPDLLEALQHLLYHYGTDADRAALGPSFQYTCIAGAEDAARAAIAKAEGRS